MPEYAQNSPPNIPLRHTASPFEEFGRCFFLPSFVLCPRIPPIPARFSIFHLVRLLPSFVGDQPREDEDGFDAKLFESA